MRTPFRPEPASSRHSSRPLPDSLSSSTSRSSPISSSATTAAASSPLDVQRSSPYAVPSRSSSRDSGAPSADMLPASWAAHHSMSSSHQQHQHHHHHQQQQQHRSNPMTIPCGPSSPSAHPKSFVPPHLLANASRSPERMARSYSKRRPPSWL